jgi:hypothetical protein
MVLPVAVMIIGIALGALSLQLERLKLVTAAATVSRALARGESVSKLAPLISGHKLLVTEQENYLCAELVAKLALPGLPGKIFSISDRECARKLGL